MKVLHVVPYMHPRAGGPVVVVDRLCRKLTAKGWDTPVITTDCFARDEPLETWDFDARPYPLDVHPVRRFPFGGSYAASPALTDDLERVAPTCDLVHVHTLWTHATAAAIRIARRRHVPFVVMPHGMLDPHSMSRKPFKKKLYGTAVEFPRLRHAAGMVYTTAGEQRLAESTVPSLPSGHIVTLGTDDPPDVKRSDAAAAFRSAYPHLADRRLVIHLGRIHPKKGLDILVPAFASVARQVPDAHLLLVGPDQDNYLDVIRGLASSRGISDRVTHIPMLTGDRKWQALAAASVFALPSYQENFGIAVAEAARMSLPLVISNRVNLWPDVQDTGAGIVTECNVKQVADAMTTLLTDDAASRQAGDAARNLARTRYTWDRSAEALTTLYEQVLHQTEEHPMTAISPTRAWTT